MMVGICCVNDPMAEWLRPVHAQNPRCLIDPLDQSQSGQPEYHAQYQAQDRPALPDAIEQMERDTIQKALEANRYNKTKTAAQLGITFRALRYKLKKLGME